MKKLRCEDFYGAVMRRLLVVTTCAVCACVCSTFFASSARALDVVVDDFQDGTDQDWRDGGGLTSTTNTADAGPNGVGDNALLVIATSRVVMFNQIQWAFDYVGAGVTQISMDVSHGNDFDLSLHFGFANGAIGSGGSGDTYVTQQNILVVGDSQWHTIAFDVSAAGWQASSGNSVAVPDAAAALGNVTQLRLIHNAVGTEFRGATGGAMFLVDNITATAVPEPGSLALLAGFGSLGLIRRRRNV